MAARCAAKPFLSTNPKPIMRYRRNRFIVAEINDPALKDYPYQTSPADLLYTLDN
jgi:hypothetical protein